MTVAFLASLYIVTFLLHNLYALKSAKKDLFSPSSLCQFYLGFSPHFLLKTLYPIVHLDPQSSTFSHFVHSIRPSIRGHDPLSCNCHPPTLLSQEERDQDVV